MEDRIRQYIDSHNMLSDCKTVIVGLSGGADSVCLFLLLSKLSKERDIRLIAVHVHHGIRGEEADRDEAYCRELAAAHGAAYEAVYVDAVGYAKDNGLSTEEAGRILRYEAFERLAEENENARIAVAHHMNDRAETVIFNMCRGSGLRGMRGIVPVNGRIIRPLLCVKREEIEEYLRVQNVEYCTDSTNASGDYTRNRIRHDVLPYLEKNINEQAVANIAAMAERLAEVEEYINQIAYERYQADVQENAGEIKLKGLETESEIIAKRILQQAIGHMAGGLKDVGEAQISRVYELLDKACGTSETVCRGVMALKESDGILLYKEKDCEQEIIAVNPPCRLWHEGLGGYFSFEIAENSSLEKISKEVYTKTFDYDKIKFGMQLRGRQPGDYFVLDSEGHQKTVNRYMIDHKINGIRKEQAVMLADGDHIMWIVGERISEAYKIDNNTKRVLRVNFERMEHGKS